MNTFPQQAEKVRGVTRTQAGSRIYYIFLYLDHREDYHALFHLLYPSHPHSKGGHACTPHACSRDGRNWTWTGQAYDGNVTYQHSPTHIHTRNSNSNTATFPSRSAPLELMKPRMETMLPTHMWCSAPTGIGLTYFSTKTVSHR
jgi:hypothetical protein